MALLVTGCARKGVDVVKDIAHLDDFVSQNIEEFLESEYDMETLKDYLNLREDVLYLSLEDVLSQEDLEYHANIGQFVYPEDFDFDEYIMVIAYGRRIRELQCVSSEYIRQHYGSSWYSFSVTFEEEYYGEKVFFYKIVRDKSKSYVPTCYSLYSYVMHGTERIRVYTGDINTPKTEGSGNALG